MKHRRLEKSNGYWKKHRKGKIAAERASENHYFGNDSTSQQINKPKGNEEKLWQSKQIEDKHLKETTLEMDTPSYQLNINEDCSKVSMTQFILDKPSARKYSRDSGYASTSNDESNSNPSKAITLNEKYKTELCKFYEINGTCKFGINCVYAHGKENLRLKKPKTSAYRTRKCLQFFDKGYCPYGNRCQFAHLFHNNLPNSKAVSYSKMIKAMASIESIEALKVMLNRPRLKVFEDIANSNSVQPSCLYNDIQALLQSQC